MKTIRTKDGFYEVNGNILDGTDENLTKLRGYVGMGMYQPQNAANVGTIWRSSLGFMTDFLFCIGGRYKKQKSDTTRAHRHLPLWTFETYQDFLSKAPTNVEIVVIDNDYSVRRPQSICDFVHPAQAAYLMGSETGGVPTEIIRSAQHYCYVPTQVCLNVACCATVILYDRMQKSLCKR